MIMDAMEIPRVIPHRQNSFSSMVASFRWGGAGGVGVGCSSTAAYGII